MENHHHRHPSPPHHPQIFPLPFFTKSPLTLPHIYTPLLFSIGRTTTTQVSGDRQSQMDTQTHSNHSSSSSSSIDWLMRGENGAAPFLWKTYQLVEDAELDSIIAWGERGESFVVRDPIEFARVVLPRNFKHGNFSSFVRQLNTYGFRKIDTDRWEFANESFVRGKRHLLKNITRRRSLRSPQGTNHPVSPHETAHSGLEDEIEKLKIEKSTLIQEVLELHQQNHETTQLMETLKQRLQTAERKQKQMVFFLSNVFENPVLLVRVGRMNEERELSSPRTRRKFVTRPSTERQMVQYKCNHQEVRLSSHGEVERIEGMSAAMTDKPLDPTFAAKPETVDFSGKAGAEVTCSVAGQSRSDGKRIMQCQAKLDARYMLPLPEELSPTESFPTFPSMDTMCLMEHENAQKFGLDIGIDIPSPGYWSDFVSYNVQDDMVSSLGGSSDVWGLCATTPGGVVEHEMGLDCVQFLAGVQPGLL
ncbi:Heat stress transcription factor A-3-like protein [Drosera capensis]